MALNGDDGEAPWPAAAISSAGTYACALEARTLPRHPACRDELMSLACTGAMVLWRLKAVVTRAAEAAHA